MDWSDLLPELVADIASRLPLPEDQFAFRGVCVSWRAAAATNKFLSKVPLLMLPEKDGVQEREFYSLSKRKICTRIQVPGVEGKRILDVGFGWILTLDNSGEVCLVKPLSYARIRLSDFTKYPYYSGRQKSDFITRALLTANPSETSDFLLLVDTGAGTGIWRNGDDKWNNTIISANVHMAYLNRKMYVMYQVWRYDEDTEDIIWDLETDLRRVEIRDPHGTHDLSEPQKTVTVDIGPLHSGEGREYLVVSTDGELLVITRSNDADHFGVKRVDIEEKECEDIYDLGTDAVFLGDNVAVSVDAAEFPGVLKPNCIYFTDYRDKDNNNCSKNDMGIYNVGDGSIERFGVETFSRKCPPMWVFPSF